MFYRTSFSFFSSRLRRNANSPKIRGAQTREHQIREAETFLDKVTRNLHFEWRVPYSGISPSQFGNLVHSKICREIDQIMMALRADITFERAVSSWLVYPFDSQETSITVDAYYSYFSE